MPTSSIVVITIRMFVLHALLQSTWFLPTLLFSPVAFNRGILSLERFGFIVLLFVLLGLLWKFAPRVARIACRDVDATVNFSSVTLADLYKFSFVFLGLCFVLSSVGDVINWLHYLAMNRQELGGEPKMDHFYKFTRPVLTLGAGLISMLGAPVWTRKLLRSEPV